MAEKEYIERGALLAEDFTDSFVDVYDVAIFEYIIESAPAADVVEVVHARWIRHNHMSRSPYARNYDCSACGNSPIEIGDFCNKCGAKMDGGKTE